MMKSDLGLLLLPDLLLLLLLLIHLLIHGELLLYGFLVHRPPLLHFALRSFAACSRLRLQNACWH